MSADDESGTESDDTAEPSDRDRPASKGRYRTGTYIDDRYQLLRRLGEGGMGTVWAAHHHGLDAQYAIKLVTEERSTVLAARLLREARAAARLSHPAVVRVHDSGTTKQGDPFLVMELLNGQTLWERLAETERVPSVEAVQMFVPIAQALAEAHEHGVVHRDIKPDNIFLERLSNGQTRPKLFDFGVAKVRSPGDEVDLTQSGYAIGTPEYFSPEQAHARPDVDHRSDVWGLCATLYEAITGRKAFGGDDTVATLSSVFEAEPRPSSELAAGDRALWKIISRGLRKDATERWSSMQELSAALEEWLAERGVGTDATGAPLPSLRRSSSASTDRTPGGVGGSADRAAALHGTGTPAAEGPVVENARPDESTSEAATAAAGGGAAPDTPPATPTVGDVIIGKYRLERCVGRGYASVVFRATQLDLVRPVAVKVLTAEADGEDRQGDRLQREARLIAGIRHPGLAEVYETGRTEAGIHFIAMELLEGESLRDRLDREGRLRADEVVELGAWICQTLRAVHEKGYIHRDIKPANILLAKEDSGKTTPKLVDFGTARQIDVKDAAQDAVVQRTLLGVGKKSIRTIGGMVFGTPRYMSPEQAMAKPLGARSDLYSLGAVLYEMLAGVPVFDDDSAARLLARHIAEPPVPIAKAVPDAKVPEALDGVILKLLSKEPSGRYRSAEELERALRAALTTGAAPPVLDAGDAAEVAAGVPSSGASPWPVVGAALLLVAGVGGFFAFRDEPAPPAPLPVETRGADLEPVGPPAVDGANQSAAVAAEQATEESTDADASALVEEPTRVVRRRPGAGARPLVRKPPSAPASSAPDYLLNDLKDPEQ